MDKPLNNHISVHIDKHEAWTWVCAVYIVCDGKPTQEDIDNSILIAKCLGEKTMSVISENELRVYAYTNIGKYAKDSIWTLLNIGKDFGVPGALLSIEGAEDEFRVYFHNLKLEIERIVYENIKKMQEDVRNG